MLLKLSMFIIKTRFKKNFKNIYLKLLVVYSLCNYYYMMLINVFYIIGNYIHHVHISNACYSRRINNNLNDIT
jgi:hypothetical protein